MNASYGKRLAGAQPNIDVRRSAVIDGLPRHLRLLAHSVEKLNVSRNPETFAAMKGEIGR